MNQDLEIKEFEEWALNLGCPIDSLPPKKTLSRIFCSGQALAFAKMMNRVKAQQEVKEARDRITIHAINKVNGKILSKFSKQKLPEEMQRWMKINKLRARIKETKARLAETQSEYKRFAELVKENNISKMRSNEMLENRVAKVAILQAKLAEVEQKIKKEQSLMENVQKVMPVKIEQNNANDSAASAAIANAIAALEAYYSIDFDDNSYEANADTHDKLWERLRQTFANIPNYILWNNLFKQKDMQLMTIDVMSKMNVNKMLEVSNGTGINASGFKTAVGKLYAKHIGLEVEKRLLGREKQRLLDDYVVYYESFVINLRAKYAMFNNVDIDDDFLDNYMQQYSTSCYSQGQIEFLQKSIETLESEIQQRNQMQQDHQLITNSLRCIYEEIESLYCQMQDDMNALNTVRGKLEHNEGRLRYLVQSKNEQQTLCGGGARLNASSSTSSFNSSNESVMCSTKLDCFESTMVMRSDMVAARPMPMLIMPLHLTELKTFLEIPMEKFKSQMSMHNQMEMSGNPLVRTHAFDSIPKEMIEMIPHHLQTPNSALKQLQAEYEWLVQQRQLLTEVVVPGKVPSVDTAKLNQLKSTQVEQLTEITDKINVICSKTTQILNDVGRFYKFLLDNPLEKYIPKGKLFNGRNYYDYEREFTMYYNMLEQ